MKRILTIIICFVLIKSWAQDAQLSQYYATATYLNPAFSGVQNNSKTGLQYRNQWRGIGNAYTTSLVHAEHLFEKYNSGVGLLFINDREGAGSLQNTEVAGMYSFRLKLSENAALIPSIQGSYVQRSIDFAALNFADQYTKAGVTGGTSESFPSDKVTYVDFAAGLLYFNPKFFLGSSVHHLTEPEQSFSTVSDKVNMKISTHLGYKMYLNKDPKAKREKSFVLTALYKAQGKYDQVDAGMYFNIDPLTFGVWYRGLPFKVYEDFRNNESLIGMAGIQIKKFRLSYSYDFVFTALQGNGGSVHEIALNYEFYIAKPVKTPKMGSPIPVF